MKGLYLLLDAAALAGPVILSFDKKVRYIASWKNVILASLVISIPFLTWDILFTKYGVWGFNEDYIIGVALFGLPIEEILFFLIVPFACTFIYACFQYYLKEKNTYWIDMFVMSAAVVYISLLMFINPTGWYTLTACVVSVPMLVWWMFQRKIKHIGITFVVSLVPFLIMNGILTGFLTDEPIVWYNNHENVKIRIGTIPIEDVMYGMTLIVSVILLFETITRRKNG